MKIIIAIDGSECSLTALESAADRPWPQDTEFLVLSVVESIRPDDDDWDNSDTPRPDEAKLIKGAEELVAERVEFLKRELPHNPVSGKVVAGNVRDLIVQEATEWDADFIIMGSHGRKGIQKYLVGSVAEAVVSKAPCSVEIIRALARTAKGSENQRTATASN